VSIAPRADQWVQITDGPFADEIGVLETILPDGVTARVLVSHHGRRAPIELTREQYEPIDADSVGLVAATSNPHKLEEIHAVLEPLRVRVFSLTDFAVTESIPEPDENADTFAGNAAIKAIEYARALGRPCLADDSGLEVDALRGAPGVHSARYAGVEGSRAERDAANNAKLLGALKDVPDDQRAARFVCAMCVADPDGTIIAVSRGTFDGVIGRAPRGDNGFGYDPLLVLPDGRTSAELSPEEKNARSHRGAALRSLAQTLSL